MKLCQAFLLASLLLICIRVDAALHYSPGSDITSQLEAAIASGENGIGPNRAVIKLPAGTFKISRSINLHGSTLSGAGETQTILECASDLGKFATAFFGDVKPEFGHFEIDNLTLQAPRLPGGVPSGTCPNQMSGVRLTNNGEMSHCILYYFNSGVLIDGNHHTLVAVTAQRNYSGIEYVRSSDNSYCDDFFENCSFTANGLTGVKIDDDTPMGSVTFLRVHTGYEPYSFYLGHNSVISGSQFLQTQFEGVGNADIGDSDGTSTVAANYFASCSGWGGRYNNRIAADAVWPSLRCGTFLSNVIFCSSMMGPTPGDLSAGKGFYGNTWICDSIMHRDISLGKISAIVSIRSNIHLNTLLVGGEVYRSMIATKSVSAGQLVQGDGQRYEGCEPYVSGAVLGRSLAPAPEGSIAWISYSSADIAKMKIQPPMPHL